MTNKLYRFKVEFEDKRILQRGMFAENEEEVKEYFERKFKGKKFKIIEKEEMGVRI